jgi:trans-aconitate methyltransferase
VADPAVRAPERIAWTVALLDVRADLEVLEVGCGPGVAVDLVCRRLGSGRVTGIDRSATAIRRAEARNAEHLAAGRAVLVQTDLATYDGEAGRFHTAFAVNVNLFWTGDADAELAVLHLVLRPDGVVRLVYERPGGARDVSRTVVDNLARHGFTAEVVRHPSGAMSCVTARRVAHPVATRG